MNMQAQIIEQLSIIEKQYSIKIRYACESGSQAWKVSTALPYR